MSPAGNQSNPEPSSMTGRRSTRVPIVVPITVRGVDASGQAFKENTWTIGINKQGARMATFHSLPVGGEILILNPVLGRSARAHVVWIGEKRYREDPYEVGVELIDVVNVWDVKFPPEDWLRSAPIGPGTGRLERAPMGRPGQQVTTPAASEFARAPRPVNSGSLPLTTKEPSPHPSKLNAINLGPLGLSRLAEQAHAPVPARSQPPETPSVKPSAQIDSQIQARLQEVEKDLKELEEKKQSVGFIEERLTALAERLLSCRDSLEAVLGRAQELQNVWRAEAEKTQRSIREAGRQALESATAEVGEKLRKEMEVTSFRLAEETRTRIQEEVSASVEVLSRDAPARLAKLTEEYLSRVAPQLQARQSEAIEQAREQLVLVVQAAAADLTEKLRKIADEMEASLAREIEKSLEAENYPRKLSEMSSSALESFQRKMEALLEAHLQKAGEKYTEVILNQLRKEAGDPGAQPGTGIKIQVEQVVKEACGRVFRQVGVGTIVLKDWADRTRAQLEAFLRESAEAFQKQIAEISIATLEKNRHEAKALAEELQGRLQQAARVFQKKGAEALPRKDEDAPGPIGEPSHQQLRAKTEEYLDLVIEQLRETPKQALNEETEAFRKKLAEALAWFHHGTKETGEKNS